MKLVITVNEQLEKCGDEYLDERDFDIEVEVTPYAHVRISTEEHPCMYVRKRDILDLAAIIKSQEN